jgi:N-acetylglucosaminyldiphosphoundecaprenol N-acetyl-beta-D-mannosaminyltransferase
LVVKSGSAEALMTKYPQAVVGADSQVILQKDYLSLENNAKILAEINQVGAKILLVAFGQVKQETWIAENLKNLPNIKVAIGVGGTFDYLAGQVKRAPSWMRSLGLEWLFRLIMEPQRIGRIWNATVGFSWLVLREKMRKSK